MLRPRTRRILSAGLLIALSLPVVVTLAITVHEATHHRHGDAQAGYLFAVVHGHHHDQEIGEHDHEAVAAKTRAGSLVERLAAQTLTDECPVEASALAEQRANSRPLLEPPRTSALCIWRL